MKKRFDDFKDVTPDAMLNALHRMIIKNPVAYRAFFIGINWIEGAHYMSEYDYAKANIENFIERHRVECLWLCRLAEEL